MTEKIGAFFLKYMCPFGVGVAAGYFEFWKLIGGML